MVQFQRPTFFLGQLTADFNGSFEFQEDGLIYEDFARPGAEILDLVFLELNWLSWSITTDCVMSVNWKREIVNGRARAKNWVGLETSQRTFE